MMETISFASSSPCLSRLANTTGNHHHHRSRPGIVRLPVAPRAIYCPDIPLLNGTSGCDGFFFLGSSHVDWQSSYAILSSRVDMVLQQQQQQQMIPQQPSRSSGISDSNQGEEGDEHDNEAHQQQDPLDLIVSGDKTTTTNNNTIIKVNGSSSTNIVRPLTIADLSPAPMHGSHLRVTYQGVLGAYSKAEERLREAIEDCSARTAAAIGARTATTPTSPARRMQSGTCARASCSRTASASESGSSSAPSNSCAGSPTLQYSISSNLSLRKI